MKAIFFITVIFLITSNLLGQQEFSDWLKNQGKSIQEYKENKDQEFEHFKDARDSAFVEFLKQEWQAFEVFKGLKPEQKPKPETPPATELEELPEEVEETSIRIEEVTVPVVQITHTVESVRTLFSRVIKEKEILEFEFFQVPLKVNYDSNMTKIQLSDSIKQGSIAAFWADLAKSDYEDLVDQILQIKQEMQLNDWGFVLLVDRLAEAIYPDSDSKQTLLTWFVLLKSRYDARVGFNKDSIHLLVPFSDSVYNVPYYLTHQTKYYLVDFDHPVNRADHVYTYQGEYSEDPESLALNLLYLPVVGEKLIKNHFQFQYAGQVYPVQIDLSEPLIAFYKQYPQTDFTIYFQAPLSSRSMHALGTALKPLIEDKSEAEAVNILLRFVQTAFGYQKDDQQFGFEKPLFAEETLFYPYSDCEDRSVLFAWLVKNLLNLDVIGLDYPGHVATAVMFSTDIPGDAVIYEGHRYLICDPTYIHANIGQGMEKYQNVDPAIIRLK